MESTTTAALIRDYLNSFECHGAQDRFRDIVDEDVVEVLAGVPWVREALAEYAPCSTPEDQRDVLFCLRALAA